MLWLLDNTRLACFPDFSRSLCLGTAWDWEISATTQRCPSSLGSRIRQWLWTLKPSFALCQRKNSMQPNKSSVLTWTHWSPFRWVHWSYLSLVLPVRGCHWHCDIFWGFQSRSSSLHFQSELTIRWPEEGGLYHWGMKDIASSCHSYLPHCSTVFIEHKCMCPTVQVCHEGNIYAA